MSFVVNAFGVLPDEKSKAAFAGRLSQVELTHKTLIQLTPLVKGRAESGTAESVRPVPD